MFVPRQEDAEKKFWRTPNLIETLLPFLDANSTLALVKVLPLALDIVQMKTMWIKLVERACPYDKSDGSVSCFCFCQCGCCGCGAKVLEKQRAKRELIPLVDILKLMSEEDTKPRLSELLHLICRRFPPGEDSDDWPEEPDDGTDERDDWTEETDDETEESEDETEESGDEAVEGAMGTTVQVVERVARHFPKEIELIALQARLLRQRDLGVETRVDSHQLTVDSVEGARAIKALMQYCHTVTVRYLEITADIGMEGWRAVSEAISFKDVDLSLRTKSKNCLASARTEDLASMWKNPNFHNLVFEEDGGLRVFVTEGFFEKLVETQANVFPEYNLYDNYRRLLRTA